MIDCLIIGAGPAGLTAAIYLRRFLRSILLVDAGQSRALQIPLTRNFPGFPDGVSGEALLSRLHEQLRAFGGDVTKGRVATLRRMDGSGFTARLGEREIHARTVLLATGMEDVEPALAGFREAKEAGLARFCPICDGYDFRGRRIGVIGAGEHGLREAGFIRNFSERIAYITLGRDAVMEESLREEMQKLQLHHIAGEAEHLRFDSEQKLLQLKMKDGGEFEFEVLYCALGGKVRSQLAVALGAAHDSRQCLMTNEHMETSVEGLFAAGDVVSSLDQLAVAAGQAAIASTAIHNRL